MNTFTKGFFVGVTTVLVFFFVINFFNSTEKILTENQPNKYSVDKGTVSLVTNKLSIKEEFIKKEASFNKTDGLQSLIKHKVKNGRPKISQTDIFKITNRIKELSPDEIIAVVNLIDHITTKLPNELFEKEDIDYDWSIIRTAELEYNFYDQSNLQNIGELKSIICKSMHCQIKITIPSYEKFHPSNVTSWLIPASVTVKSNQKDNDQKLIEIIVARKN